MNLETTIEVKPDFPLNVCPKCTQKTLQCSYEGDAWPEHNQIFDKYNSLCTSCGHTSVETEWGGYAGYDHWTDCPYCHESSQNHKKRALPYTLEVNERGS